MAKLQDDTLFQLKIDEHPFALDYFRFLFKKNIYKLCYLLDASDPHCSYNHDVEEICERQFQLLGTQITKKEMTCMLLQKLNKDFIATRGRNYDPIVRVGEGLNMQSWLVSTNAIQCCPDFNS